MLNVARLLPSGLRNGYNLAVAVRNRLYMIESCSDAFEQGDAHYYSGGLHCLAANRDDHCLTAADRSRDQKWDWRQLPDSPGFSWSWSNWPPELRFDAQSIIAHAVHPRGRTIFLSVAAGEYPVESGTYTYGTGSGRWRRCGNWMLPFKGQGHYDYELDAWVGLHLPPDEVETSDVADGHICACSVTSAAASRLQPPEWKVGREKLFLEDTDWRHMDAKLVYMGEGSMYCLVERLQGEGSLLKKYGLRLTTFSLRYGEDGELLTVAHRPAGFYEFLSCSSGDFVAQAFWM
ncbi:unnamed protein product [Triticum turgidum subsp. durum]|uniref:Uncharacterized protein n=1 Tax=Triticum turgidum subsp. durum TaxID=4567 RepID=A0A9R0QRU7_TRITD|nr:unnamed protein product [Triticum turgidum subsp. durum]